MLRPPAVGDDIELRTIDVEPLVLAVPADHRLAVEPVVSLTDLRSESFVAYSAATRRSTKRCCAAAEQAGFVPHREHAAPGTAVLLALVAAGLGVAVRRRRSVRCRCTGVVFRDLLDGGYHRARPGLARTACDSPVVDAVVDVLASAFVPASHPSPRRSAMKITAVEAIPFAIPYIKPLKFASGEVHTAEHVLVRVHTDDGVVGVAEAPPRPFTYGETQAGIIAVIEQIFAPADGRV